MGLQHYQSVQNGIRGAAVDDAATTTSESLSTENIIFIVVGSLIFVLLLCVIYLLVQRNDATQAELSPIFQPVEGSSTAPPSTENRAPSQPSRSTAPNNSNENDDNIDEQITRWFAQSLVQLHTTKGPKAVIMAVTKSQLTWSSPVTGKKYAIDMKEIKHVDIGKQSMNFGKKTSAAAPEDRCFSLICQSTTIDIEVSSSLVRDHLVVCFSKVVSRLHEQSIAPYEF